MAEQSNKKMENPFIKHEQILLDDYSAARTLRQLMMSMYAGRNYPFEAHRIRNLDQQHFQVAIEIMTWYRAFGEDDQFFMSLARKVERENMAKQAE